MLPPCADAGGWEGLRRLPETCERLRYLRALHQYRDHYHDAPSHEPRHALLGEDGQRPYGRSWFGGSQSILCARLAPGLVAGNCAALHRAQTTEDAP